MVINMMNMVMRIIIMVMTMIMMNQFHFCLPLPLPPLPSKAHRRTGSIRKLFAGGIDGEASAGYTVIHLRSMPIAKQSEGVVANPH